MKETHPFPDFVPENSRYLILGSFVARKHAGTEYDWYYSNGRNQFWSILELAYGMELKDKETKQALFTDLGIALTDMIKECERREDNALDNNLINIVYNMEGIEKIFRENSLHRVLFSSRYVEKSFFKVFKHLAEEFPKVEFIALPSPSPRYARMTKLQKAERYRELLPTLS